MLQLSVSVFIFLLFVMSHLCASKFGTFALEFDMPHSWSRGQHDVTERDFSVKVNPASGLHSCCVYSDCARDLVIMGLENDLHFYFSLWRQGKTLVDVSQKCSCCVDHHATGYVFNAPLNSVVGGLSVVPPIGKPVAPRFSQKNSMTPQIFCEYCVDETFFSAKLRLCEYRGGGFFFVRVKFMYEDKNNIFVSWGEETPCGRTKVESFDDCKFSFNAPT